MSQARKTERATQSGFLTTGYTYYPPETGRHKLPAGWLCRGEAPHIILSHELYGIMQINDQFSLKELTDVISHHEQRYYTDDMSLGYRREREQRMSTVNLCERCDAACSGSAIGTINYRINPDTPYSMKDLCPACVGDLVKFLATTPTEDRQKTYREPFRPEQPQALSAELVGQIVAEAMAQLTEQNRQLGTGQS